MTTTKTQAQETLHPFIWEPGAAHILRDASHMGLHEFDEGLDSYLKQCKYHLLPGGVPPFEVWETGTQAPARFTVIARYEHITIVVQIPGADGLRTFMEKFIPVATILPEIVLPDLVIAPNNVRTAYFMPGAMEGTGKYV